MWKEKLEILKKEMELYQEKTNSGIVDKEILKFQREVRKEFGYELPPDYLKLLKYINGFEYNGFILYQVDEYLTNVTSVNQHVSEFIDTNKIWYKIEENKEYIFIGDSDISFWVYSLHEKIYYELDKPVTDNIINKFKTLDELLESFFSDVLPEE